MKKCEQAGHEWIKLSIHFKATANNDYEMDKWCRRCGCLMKETHTESWGIKSQILTPDTLLSDKLRN